MITAVTDRGTLETLLGEKRDIYTEKIRALAAGYGFGYDFCTFAAQDNSAVICSYYGGATAALTGELTDSQTEELAAYLTFGQYDSVLMSYPLCERLGLSGSAEKLCLMKCNGDVKKTIGYDKENPVTDSPLSEIYEIVSGGFDIDRDMWYTDTSHMIRHGIARAYVLGGKACAIRMFASGGISYVSYVCTRPEARGKGLATALLAHICAENAANGIETFVFCENKLRPFYESAGFELAGKAGTIHNA